MSLTTSEVQSLRFHLGYGNVTTGAYPYTPDGFYELFRDVIAPNLDTGNDTTGSGTITSGSAGTVTVLSLTGIVARERIVVDVGDDAEIVVVKATGTLTFAAAFAKDHSGSYPVSTLSGEQRLRMLLNDADKAWQKAQSSAITKTAGLKQLDRGAIEWFHAGAVLHDTMSHYRSIVQSISDLVRVKPRSFYEGSGRLEAY